MLAITQFEVYVLQKGRWTIHARYPGEERSQAILDARTTESSMGFPAKVIRETYFPEVNESERITVYASAKLKDQQLKANERRRTPLTAARAAANAITRRTRPTAMRTPLTGAQIFFRVIVAGGISLLAATMTTGLVAWTLYRVADAGVEITVDARTMTLTYAYVIMFLFFFWSLFRSRLPLHRMLADLWAKASKQTAPVTAQAFAGKPPAVKPKHNRPPSPETLRELDDLKVKRGDVDLMPKELVDVEQPVMTQPPEKPVEKPAEKIVEKPVEKAAAASEAQQKAEAAKKKEEKEAAALAETQVEQTQAEETPQVALNLERLVLRRFAADVVKPAVRNVMPDDPVARRGAAIVVAGGAAGVAATAKLSPGAETELLTDALQHIDMNQGAIDLFLAQRAEQITVPASAALLAAGRSALAAHLEGATDVAGSLARTLANWRTPVGPVMVAENALQTVDADAVPLLDVYMLTELREPAPLGDNENTLEAFHDQAMGAHNGVVRASLAAHGGHEVKHTGKGIFARFATAQAAVNAALDMQRSFVGNAAKLAIGLIGNTTAGEDPILSANLVHHAQAIVARTGPGEILCEAQVQAALRRHQSENDLSALPEELDLVRLAMPEPDFEAPPPNTTANDHAVGAAS